MLKFIKYLFFSLMFASLLGLFIFFYYSQDLPTIGDFSEKSLAQSTKIYDRTGEIILYEVFNTERRTFVTLNDISESLKVATLAAEDANFYQHPAFDVKAIFRAITHNLLNPQALPQGGSTITQQLVKNTLLTRERTLTEKSRRLSWP